MKILIAIAVTALAASAVTLSLDRLLRPPDQPAPVGISSGLSATPALSAAAPDHSLDLRLSSLEASLAAFEQRLANSQLDLNRQVAAAPTAQATSVASGVDAGALLNASPEARALVESVLEEQRLARETEREQQRAAAAVEINKLRAANIAKELGLSPADTDTLASIFNEESTRRREFFESIDNGNGFPAPEALSGMRDGMDAIRDWKSTELSARLGSGVAEQIQELDRDRGPGGFGGFGGGGRGSRGPDDVKAGTKGN